MALVKLPVDPLPDHVTCAKRDERRAKQCGTKLLGRGVCEVKKDAVLLVKAFEIGFAQENEKSKRLLTQSSSWSTLREKVPLEVIVQNLKCGIQRRLQHLRTLDVHRDLCDRASELVEGRYDIWIWMTGVK